MNLFELTSFRQKMKRLTNNKFFRICIKHQKDIPSSTFFRFFFKNNSITAAQKIALVDDDVDVVAVVAVNMIVIVWNVEKSLFSTS